MQLRGGNSASFAGGLLRTIAGCSAELNVVTNQSRDSGSVKMETGNVPFGEAGHIGIVSGRECCRGGAIVASAGSGPRRSWRGGSADVHAGKSCLSGGGDIYVRGGAGSISEGGGVSLHQSFCGIRCSYGAENVRTKASSSSMRW